MKLLTKEIEKKLIKHPFGSQEGKGDDAEVIAKFFTPDAQATWLVTEGEQMSDGDWEFFGMASLGYGFEWGYFLLSEIEKARGNYGLSVERDLYSHGTIGELKGE